MTVVERKLVAAGQQLRQQPEQKKPWEPTTAAERMDFIRDVNRRYLRGEISYGDLWAYEQKYGLGRPGEKTI